MCNDTHMKAKQNETPKTEWESWSLNFVNKETIMALPQTQGQDIEVKQLKEFLGSYNRMTELCFTDCVNEFTTRKPTDSEIKCSHHCLEKFLKMSQRITTRFQEYQMQQNEGLLAAQAKLTRWSAQRKHRKDLMVAVKTRRQQWLTHKWPKSFIQ